MLIAFNSICQQDTRIVQNKDTIHIGLPIAKKIVKDLYKLDQVLFTDSLLRLDTSLFKQQIALKDSTIHIYQSKDSIHNSIEKDYITTTGLLNKTIKDDHKKISWLKFQRSSFGIGVIVAIIYIIAKTL